MLPANLYTIEKITGENSPGNISCLIRLNADSEIFKGHFPGNPLLPGVCVIEIIKELLSDHIKNKILITKIDSVKFLSFINPEVNPLIIFNIEINETEDDCFICNAVVLCGTIIFSRFKGHFRIT